MPSIRIQSSCRVLPCRSSGVEGTPLGRRSAPPCTEYFSAFLFNLKGYFIGSVSPDRILSIFYIFVCLFVLYILFLDQFCTKRHSCCFATHRHRKVTNHTRLWSWGTNCNSALSCAFGQIPPGLPCLSFLILTIRTQCWHFVLPTSSAFEKSVSIPAQSELISSQIFFKICIQGMTRSGRF